MAFNMRTSIRGRRLGISSSGAIINAYGSTGNESTAYNMAAQMWGPAMFQTVSSAGATISNTGITVISTDSTSGTTPFILAAPSKGIEKEIHIHTSATALALNTNSTSSIFQTTLSYGAALGSTTLTIAGVAAGTAGTIILRALTDSAWALKSASVSVSS